MIIELPQNLEDREHLLKLVQLKFNPSSYQPRFRTEFFKYESSFIFPKDHLGAVTITQKDSLQAAQNLENSLVLILADDERPGGNYLALAGMHEESLFLRSALWRHLIPSMYPLGKLEALYARDVPLIDGTYQSFIACPGLKFPHLLQGKLRKDDRLVLSQKIELILQVAQSRGHKNIVLSALGCGVWSCPAKEVAEVFWEAITKYRTAFENIVFAILGSNYKIFRSVFDDLSSRT